MCDWFQFVPVNKTSCSFVSSPKCWKFKILKIEKKKINLYIFPVTKVTVYHYIVLINDWKSFKKLFYFYFKKSRWKIITILPMEVQKFGRLRRINSPFYYSLLFSPRAENLEHVWQTKRSLGAGTTSHPTVSCRQSSFPGSELL